MKYIGLAAVLALSFSAAAAPPPLTVSWADNYLTITGPKLAGAEIKIHYLEAYCRAGSTDADWREHTKVPHQTELIEASVGGTFVKLRCHVADGLVVDHEIRAQEDAVDFQISATNPTEHRSEALWAQPCVRLDKFTGGDKESYPSKCFIFLDGELARMPTRDWATEARYVPGQVWAPKALRKIRQMIGTEARKWGIRAGNTD